MKIVVIGGTGLIGSKLVRKLREQGHQAVPASPDTGVNTLTGAGLAEALKGAAVVVDVSNSPSLEDTAVLKFFETSTRNILSAEAAAGVGHHVALSVVGAERLSESGYIRAKIAQEKLIRESSIPYSIVHATQFFESIKSMADAATVGNTVWLAPVLIQPMAAEDVAGAVARIAVGPPVNGVVEVAGPQAFRFDEFIQRAPGNGTTHARWSPIRTRATMAQNSASARCCPATAPGSPRPASMTGSARPGTRSRRQQGDRS